MQFAVMGVGMKWVVYQKRGNPNAILMIMETTQPMQGGASLKQQREQMLRQMQQQGQRPGNVNTDLSEESTETREFTIGGEKVPFEFIKGTSAQGPSRQVVGVFQGRNGVIMVMLIVPESDYDEAAVVRMLESIRLPDDEAEAESMDEPEAHDQPEKDDGAAPADESKAAEKNNEQDPPSESSP
jgi:hypothetical protein